MNLLKVERYKNYHRTEFYLSFITLLIPLIFAYSMVYTDMPQQMDYDKPGGISIFTMLSTCLGMASSIGIFHIFYSVIAANSMAYELENGYYMMYFPKLPSKTKLLRTKQRVITESLIISLVVFIVMAILILKILVKDNGIITTKFFDQYSFYMGMSMLAIVFELIAFVNLTLVLGLFFRTLQTIIISVALFYGQIIGASIPLIKYLMPKHHLQNILDFKDWTNHSQVLNLTLVSIGISVTILLVATYIGHKKVKNDYI
ncbi:hypothetical protein HMPREF1987_00806 [Peptostreptococcaceae bacterium oral taxon 113 str. W5053]|nr:hypothetical protein HMPREF1987_00806 [Peptostreptococcaceae bacterium oral taxon 113 str. W5053]